MTHEMGREGKGWFILCFIGIWAKRLSIHTKLARNFYQASVYSKVMSMQIAPGKVFLKKYSPKMILCQG